MTGASAPSLFGPDQHARSRRQDRCPTPYRGRRQSLHLGLPALAAYAGLAPITRRSCSSIRGEHPSRGGNKVLKRALFLSACAALRAPVSRA